MRYDYFIIGQGIAGTVLSYTFHRHEKSFLVIDEGPKTSSSKVAAGDFNHRKKDGENMDG